MPHGLDVIRHVVERRNELDRSRRVDDRELEARGAGVDDENPAGVAQKGQVQSRTSG
jgi:hypothetical protein